eukprot:jgi/Mesvir1/2973/Mv09599-RA.1
MEETWYDDFTAKKQPAKKEPPGSDAEPAKPPATAAGGDEEPEYLNKYLREHYSTDKRKVRAEEAAGRAGERRGGPAADQEGLSQPRGRVGDLHHQVPGAVCRGPLRLPPSALLDKLGACAFAAHRRLSMSVVYGYGGRETAVLSATLGRCSPHPDDKDITDALSAFLGPDRDFYASAGLPQYIWCIIRHIGIDAIVAGASKPGSDQADVQDEFMRVIYGSGECLLFHPKAGGCLVTGGVKVG